MLTRFDFYVLIREKRRANKNSQSRDTRIRGHKVQNKDKLNIEKTYHKTQKTSNTETPGVNLDPRAVHVSYMTPVVLLI